MNIDFSDGINNALEYQLLNNHDAAGRVISAFKTTWRNGNRNNPTEIVSAIMDNLGIDPTLLSSWEINKISTEIGEFINE